MNCDSIARWYKWLEYLTFGAALQKRRLEYVDDVAKAKKVLILGDGDGRFTARFLKRNGTAVVDSIDVSAGMLRLAEQRIQRVDRGGERVRLFAADAMTMELPGSYDLIVSHFFLDCFTTEQVERMVRRVRAAACPGVEWLISEFCVPRGRLRRWAAKLLIHALYLSFRMLTGLKVNRLPDYATVFRANGFRRLQNKSALGGLLISELWQGPTRAD